MQVASIPLTQYQRQEDGVKTEISAYGQLKNSLTTFQSSLSNLTLAANFKTMSVTSSDKSVANADVFTGAQPGNYAVKVDQLAQAQTLVSGGQTSVNAAIGSGSPTKLTFNFGTIGSKTPDGAKDAAKPDATEAKPDDKGHYPDGTTFSPTTGTNKTLTIDSSNNTLGGIRDAINNASMGVTASIVNDGSATPYRLVLTNNKTGAAQAVQITTDGGDDDVASMLSFDPSDPKNQGMSQTTVAQDAKLSVNGIAVNSPTNRVASALNGFTLNLSHTGTTTLAVADDSSAIEKNISDFVDAYNAMAGTLASLTNYDSSDSSKNGPLLGDATTANVKMGLQRMVTGTLEGGDGFDSLGEVGISFNNDGTLSLDGDKLKTALSTHMNQFASLFATNGTTSDPGVNFLTAGPDAKAGKYNIDISQAATQGEADGVKPADLSKAATDAMEMTVTLDGATQNITVPKADYKSASDLATAVQKAINANSTFTTNGASVNVTADDDGYLSVSSTSYGSSSNVGITGNGALTVFGDTTIKGDKGVDVKGTIGGYAADGKGQMLTGGKGTPTSSIALQVSGDTTGWRGTTSYSVGFGARLDGYVKDVTGTGGSLDTATKALNTHVSSIEKQISKFQDHLSDVQSNYQRQFSRLNQLSVKMKTASNMLDAQFNRTTSG